MPLRMALASRPPDRNTALAAIVFAAGLYGYADPALALPWLHDAFGHHGQDGRHAEAPRIAHYAIDDGGGFVVDRSGRQPLLKFDWSPEIWALSPSRGPRGDIIYKNDLGEPVLRATRLGGMTVFTPRRPAGSAASVSGVSSPLRLASIGPVALYQRMFQASLRSSRAAQHLIAFEAPDVDATSDGLIADSATVAMEAVVRLSDRPDGKVFLARVNKIVFRVGKRPDVIFKDGVITVALVPPVGIVGRPSSRRILWLIGGGGH